MKTVALSLTLLLVVFFASGQPGKNNSNFSINDTGNKTGDGAIGRPLAAAFQPDGKILIGGSFLSHYNGHEINNLARLHADGSLDLSFKTGSGIDGTVYDILVQPDGKILVAGAFAVFNDTSRAYIVRLHPNGVLDKAFSVTNGPNNPIYDIALQSDGKIVIVGAFTAYQGVSRNRVARLESNGSLDLSFNPGSGANNTVWSVATLPDGKVLVGGDFTIVSGASRARVARLNSSGTLDTFFDPLQGANNTVDQILVQPDGKILVSGTFMHFGGLFGAIRVARLHSNGIVDVSFQSAVHESVYCMALQADGKILIGGAFLNAPDDTRGFVRRLHTNGVPDASFDRGTGTTTLDYTASSVDMILLESNGNVITGGKMQAYNFVERGSLCRLRTDGTLDLAFNPNTGANNTVFSTAIQPDGKIIVGGKFTLYNNEPRSRLVRLHVDGSVDASFVPDLSSNLGWVNSIAIQHDGKIIVGGFFSNLQGKGGYHHLVRLNTDGSNDSTFQVVSGPNGPVMSITTLPDNKILIAGAFSHYQGDPENFLTRLGENGLMDETWDVPFGVDGQILTLTRQSDGKMIVGGEFDTYKDAVYNTFLRRNLARLNEDGTLDKSFDPVGGASGVVWSSAVQPDGKIIVAGDFMSYRGYPKGRIVRILPNGEIDESFTIGTGANNGIRNVQLLPNGKIIIAGNFTMFNGVARNRLARLHPDGTLDTVFDPGNGADAMIYSSSILPNGNILIAGDFVNFDGEGRNRVAEVLEKGTQLISFDPIDDVLAGSPSFSLNAKSTVNLPVAFHTDDPEVSIENNNVTALLPGKVTISAMQEGNENFSEAIPVEQTFCVNPIRPAITADLSDPLTPSVGR